MTVREFIAWLSDQDQDATVQCVEVTPGGMYTQGGEASEVEFTPDLSEYTDFRGNQFVKPDAAYFNKRFLLIGEKND